MMTETISEDALAAASLDILGGAAESELVRRAKTATKLKTDLGLKGRAKDFMGAYSYYFSFLIR
jgi:hypothetical protein